MPVERLRGICDRIAYHEGAAELIASLRGAGFKLGIVSTGLTLLADRVRSELGLHYAVANELDVREGLLTGGVRVVIAHGEKDRALRDFCAAFDLDPRRVAAVGDTEGDLSMFRVAGWSIAFNPADPEVERGACVVAPGTDLRALIPLLLSSAPDSQA
jgi:phosphoserine phosphatase